MGIALCVLIGGFMLFTQTSLADKVAQAYENLKVKLTANVDEAGYGYAFQTSPARVATGSAYGSNNLLLWKLSGIDITAERDLDLPSSFPFGDDFYGGIFVAAGDVTGDGIDEIGVTSSTIGSHVLILDKDGTRRPIDFFPFESGGGLNIDMGDVTGDGKADIACGSNSGVGNVKVYHYDAEKTVIVNFEPYPETETRVKIALGDIDADGDDEIITGAASVADGPGVDPQIRTFESDGSANAIQFYAFGAIDDIAAGDIDGDGKDEIIVSSGSRLRVYRYNSDQTVIVDITAYPAEYNIGARVAAYDVDQDGKDEIITGTGDGAGPQVKVWETWETSEEMRGVGLLSSYMAYDETWRHGVDVAGGLFE